MKRRCTRALGVLFVAGLGLLPAIASAQTSTSTGAAAAAAAERHATAAKGLYRDGKYLEALDAFQKANAIAPTPALTYNIARCHERLSQWREAMAMYEKYAKEAPDARDRAEALDKVEFLKKKVGADLSTPDGMYQARVDAGRKAYSRGDYEGAIQEFKAAFDIKPTGGALYNIAKSYEKLARYEEAIDYFTQYLDLDPNVSDRSDVEETIRRLKKTLKEKFQELAVSSDPPGADIYLDDRNTGLQGQTNYRFKVTPGPHTIFLDSNGFEPVKRDFVMPDDKPLALDFKMKKLENVGLLEITVDIEGSRIFVDGAIIGLSPYKDKKALSAGSHQVQIEQPGYVRWSETVQIERDKTTSVKAQLSKYDAPVSDDTLTKWGRNLLMTGLIAGGLGVVGPFAYQKLILRRDPYEQLGPERATGKNGDALGEPERTVFYRGPLEENADGYRSNKTHTTLKAIQLWSIVGGSVFVAGSLAFYGYSWFRETPTQQPVVASHGDGPVDPTTNPPSVEVTSVGVVPTPSGATFGLSGSF